MGDTSIIARRLINGHVQYGWSGNGGYFKNVGNRLLWWYQSPKDVEYLFSLGETALIGQIGSENGGYRWFDTHSPTGEPFSIGNTEREIFSELAFIDYGYFYDIDHRWYYVIPGPFRIKIPLELIKNRLDEDDYEFDFQGEVEAKVAYFILQDYQKYDSAFADFLKNKGYDAETILGEISEDGLPSSYKLFERYPYVYKYFDDWVLIKTNADNTEIAEIIVKKRSKKHVETCNW